MTILRALQKWAACLAVVGFIAGCGGGGGGGGGGGAALAPAITAQPAATTVADGATANFSVTATGDAPLSYQWRRNGADIAGATGATLALSAPYAFDASNVTVAVSNAAGTAVSGNALLTVTPIAPTIATQPANASVAAGAPATFSVAIAGGTLPLSYQWKRNGSTIAGATAASFTLASTVLGDNGATFSVDVINPAGTLASSAATLTVTTAVAGKAWGPAVLLSSGDGLRFAGYPRVAIDAAGNAMSVWQETIASPLRGAVWARRYAAGGTWSTAATIDNAVGGAAQPQIAMTPGGVAVASFVQSTSNAGGGQLMLANRFGGTSWGTPSRLDIIDAVIDIDQRVAITPSGAATVAFNQSDNVAGRRATAAQSDAAGAWAGPVVLGAVSSYRPQVAAAANGTTVMVWAVTNTASTSSLYASRNLGTGGWSAPVLVASGAKDVGTLRVSADASGNAIFVWQESPSTRSTIRASRLSAASGVWSVPMAINDGTRFAYEPELATDGAGNTVAVWYEASDGAQVNGIVDYGVVANRYTASAAGWSGAVRVQPVGASAGVLAKVALDGVGNGFAVWLQGSPGNSQKKELWSARFDVAGMLWAPAVKLMTDPAAYAMRGSDQTPDIAINANGEAVVIWYQVTDVPFVPGIWARVYR